MLYFTHGEDVLRGCYKVGYAVVHMMKIKQGAVGGIQSHNNREHEPKTNPDVDMSRSGENYDIVPCQNYRAEIRQKLSDFVESKKAVRKDAVVACNFIVTSDQQTMEEMGAEKQRAFFEDAVKWFSDRYGKRTILNATVHMDETTPHLHIGVVPITEDGRLSAKAIFTKTEMKAIQTDFAREVGEKYGLERGVEGSEKTHLSEMRFKAETAVEMANEMCSVAEIAAQERDEALQELSEARKTLEKVTDDVKAMQTQKNVLEGEISALEGQKEEKEQELSSLTGRISDAKNELRMVDVAVKRKMDEGAGLFGMESMKERIAAARKEADKDNRLRLLERFVALPQIKPLWEQFCQLMNRGKDRKKNEWEK